MNLYKLKHILDENGILFSFSGVLSQDILATFANAIGDELSKKDVKQSVVNNIFSIFVEQAQNIMSYSKDNISNEDNQYESVGLVIIGFSVTKKKYFVASANNVATNGLEKLIHKIESVNGLNKDELKDYYKELRRTGKDSHDRGAGLGFLEMARKATEPMIYQVTQLDEVTSFFEIQVFI